MINEKFWGILIIILASSFMFVCFKVIQLDSQQTVLLEVLHNKKIELQLKYSNHKNTYDVIATAYTASIDECNSDITNTAIMIKPKVGSTIAVSQDLVHLLGKKVYIKGLGIRKVEDLMNKRYENCVDILVDTKKTANIFGKKSLTMVIL